MDHRALPSVLATSPTPFSAEGELDEAALRDHVALVTGAGIGVVVGRPGVGEGNSLTPAEFERLVTIASNTAVGDNLVLGCTPDARTFEEAARAVLRAAGAGADAVVVRPLDLGAGDRPTGALASSGYVGGVIGAPPPVGEGDGLLKYYDGVISSTETPIVLGIDTASGYILPIPLIQTLIAQHENIVGVVVATSSSRYLLRIIEHVDVAVFSETCATIPDVLAFGGHGAFSAVANVAPELCHSVFERHRAGDAGGSLDAWRQEFALHLLLCCGENGEVRTSAQAAIKAALRALGQPVGDVRAPHEPSAPLPPEIVERVRALSTHSAHSPRHEAKQ